jgi:hypothetical protein
MTRIPTHKRGRILQVQWECSGLLGFFLAELKAGKGFSSLFSLSLSLQLCLRLRTMCDAAFGFVVFPAEGVDIYTHFLGDS